MEAEKITVGIINYNGMKVLPTTLRSLQALQYPAYEIMVVDNNSTDGSREWLERCHPEVRCIRLEENIGLPGARNVVLREATTEHVFIMDNDISVEPDVLNRLMEVLQSVPHAGVCHPEIQDENDPGVYHYNGGYVHYLAPLIARDQPGETKNRPSYEVFDVVSGAALLMRRQQALAIGGFDADYFFNGEDGDFTARMTLSGYSCLNVPAAIVHHRSKPRGTSKVFYQVRNRWYFILKLYNWRTLALISPMLFLFEILQAMFLMRKGVLGDLWRGNLAVIQTLPVILLKRKAIQKQKKVKDRQWLRSGPMYIPPQLHRNNPTFNMLQRMYYGLCDSYWRVVKPLC